MKMVATIEGDEFDKKYVALRSHLELFWDYLTQPQEKQEK